MIFEGVTLDVPPGYVDDMGVNGSVCQDWVVDWAPTDIQNGRINGGIVTTPLPINLLSLASPGLKPKGRVWKADALALTRRTSLAWAAKPLNAATSACYLPMKQHHALVMPAQLDHGKCRCKYKFQYKRSLPETDLKIYLSCAWCVEKSAWRAWQRTLGGCFGKNYQIIRLRLKIKNVRSLISLRCRCAKDMKCLACLDNSYF